MEGKFRSRIDVKPVMRIIVFSRRKINSGKKIALLFIRRQATDRTRFSGGDARFTSGAKSELVRLLELTDTRNAKDAAFLFTSRRGMRLVYTCVPAKQPRVVSR